MRTAPAPLLPLPHMHLVTVQAGPLDLGLGVELSLVVGAGGAHFSLLRVDIVEGPGLGSWVLGHHTRVRLDLAVVVPPIL